MTYFGHRREKNVRQLLTLWSVCKDSSANSIAAMNRDSSTHLSDALLGSCLLKKCLPRLCNSLQSLGVTNCEIFRVVECRAQ